MHNRLHAILQQYKDYIATPWKADLSPKERTIFLVYNKEEERRMTAMVPEFRLATEVLGHRWVDFDCSTLYSRWIADHEYRESYFEEPELLQGILETDFREWIVNRFHEVSVDTGPIDVIALSGTAALYGFIKLSTVVEAAAQLTKGRLIVFFPGEYDRNMYRFLNARDGWNYLAVALTGQGDIA